ncbi:hypothetical protein Sru01_13240 [Sphaerisporangium rufum]|uniref:CopC domain-containing protein n=1 Tax=Sphaerisporangium rufum TaxID=1381558 RepID=A0A919R3G6_9ACTN|nr:copper resistance CopC family protein [Sphaerisporangium rufum]GII76342.1 hypothetical protein Sru01_13240 [Sphaerisporangium rufum]
MWRLFTVLLPVCAALVVLAGPARAHNVLTGSDPADGARLASPPAEVTLTFDQPVRAEFTQLALTGPDGVARPLRVRVTGAKVRAALPGALPAGGYAVGYRIVSNDGHPVTGRIGFSAAAPAAGASPSPAGTTAAVPSPAASAVPSPGASAGAPASGPATTAGPARDTLVAQVPPQGGGGGWVWGLLVASLLLSGLGVRAVVRHDRAGGRAGA